jgi:hypothetical protein
MCRWSSPPSSQTQPLRQRAASAVAGEETRSGQTSSHEGGSDSLARNRRSSEEVRGAGAAAAAVCGPADRDAACSRVLGGTLSAIVPIAVLLGHRRASVDCPYSEEFAPALMTYDTREVVKVNSVFSLKGFPLVTSPHK